MSGVRHVAVVAIPAFSHQASIVEFCKRLLLLHQDIHVTCIFPTIRSLSTNIVDYLQDLPSRLDCTFLQPVDMSDQPPGTPPGEQLYISISRSMNSVHEALLSLSSASRLVALVADPVATETLIFAKEINALSYVYFPYPATVVSLCLHTPTLNDTFSCEFKDMPEPIKLPGCAPIYRQDFPHLLQDRSGQAYRRFLNSCRKTLLTDGVFINSFMAMEMGPLEALTKTKTGNPSVYPIGPITRSELRNQKDESSCLEWLQKQAAKSVLYVSFGSGGALSPDQIKELALGLEMSGHKFLWVLRAPCESPDAKYLNHTSEGDPLAFLPSGFLGRTRTQGLVVPQWVPQIEVLSHEATGAFLTHCGWNSVLESVVSGVPVIAWPLFAEQKVNAGILADGLGVALRPKVDDNGVVQRGEVARVVKGLFEGEESERIRIRMGRLKDEAGHALDRDGPSSKSLIRAFS